MEILVSRRAMLPINSHGPIFAESLTHIRTDRERDYHGFSNTFFSQINYFSFEKLNGHPSFQIYLCNLEPSMLIQVTHSISGQSQKGLGHILKAEQARRYEIEVWCCSPFPSSAVWSSQTLRYIDNRTGKVPLLLEFIASREKQKNNQTKIIQVLLIYTKCCTLFIAHNKPEVGTIITLIYKQRLKTQKS